MRGTVALSVIAAAAGVASAQNFLFFNELSDFSLLRPNSEVAAAAGFAPIGSDGADQTLAGPGDAGSFAEDIADAGADFSLAPFSFELRHRFIDEARSAGTANGGLGELEWIIRDADGFTHAVSIEPGSEALGFNTISLITAGGEASIDLSSLRFEGLGLDIQSFPDLDAGPFGGGAETHLWLGNQTDLLATEWSLTGTVEFGSFLSEPGGGTGLTLELRSATGFIIPAPGAAGVLAVAGVVAGRRRR